MRCNKEFHVVVMISLTMVGCEKKQDAREDIPLQKPQVSSPVEQKLPVTTPLPALDVSKDDPSTPGWLPKPEEIAGWSRTTNVSVIHAGQWDQLRSAALRDAIEGFLIKQVTQCEFTSVSQSTPLTVAQVTIIEANQAEDAFGLFTVLNKGSVTDRQIGSLSGADRNAEIASRFCWQGKYVIQVGVNPTSTPGVTDQLLSGLVKPLPSEPAPALIDFLPTAQQINGQLWLVRKHLNALPDSIHQEALRGAGLVTTQSLGLGLDTLIVVAGYDAGVGEKPNYVWVVQYPTLQAAQGAYGQYKNALRRMKPTPLVLMNEPKNSYLCGTWTADQESIMHLLPQIAEKLPKP